MNRIETMRAAAEDSSHWWWEIGTAPADLRDLLTAVEAAQNLNSEWANVYTFLKPLREALARLDGS